MRSVTIPAFIGLLLLASACSAPAAPAPTATAAVASSAAPTKPASVAATSAPTAAAIAVAATATKAPAATQAVAQPQAPAQTPKPAQTAGTAPTSGTAPTPPPGQTPAATANPNNKLYDPSIFVIQAEGKGQKELAPGYLENWEADLYLHKIDANDNRQVEGSYQGTFWMKVSLDADQFIKDMLKNAPVTADFQAGGEAVCDNLGISLNTTDDKAWTNYNIAGEDGKPLPLTRETPVGKGSFVAVTKDVYLKAKARGAQGEKVDYSSDAGKGDLTDVNYVIHVQPNSAESGTTRKVVIELNVAGKDTITLNGTMKRLPGTREDVSDYLNSKEYQQASQKHTSQ